MRSTRALAGRGRGSAAACRAQASSSSKAGAAALAAAAIAVSAAPNMANALTKEELDSLTYLQVKGSGLANTCPTLQGGEAGLTFPAGEYNLQNFCMEPSKIDVSEEADGNYVNTKLMTRLTYTLDQITGKVNIGSDGKLSLKENDGIDYAPVTVQLPQGERVPFLFTIKQLEAAGSGGQMSGGFNVPSYRGSSFLDPKGRGASTGYEFAVALPSAEIGDVDKDNVENSKSVKTLRGNIVLTVAKSDAATGEVVGVFESVQPSDTDLGAKKPKDVKIQGLFYGQLEKK